MTAVRAFANSYQHFPQTFPQPVFPAWQSISRLFYRIFQTLKFSFFPHRAPFLVYIILLSLGCHPLWPQGCRKRPAGFHRDQAALPHGYIFTSRHDHMVPQLHPHQLQGVLHQPGGAFILQGRQGRPLGWLWARITALHRVSRACSTQAPGTDLHGVYHTRLNSRQQMGLCRASKYRAWICSSR